MIMTLDYIILALAVFRITRLITTDVIADKLRDKIWEKYPMHKNGLGYVITCDWCTSIWVASPTVLMYKITAEPTIAVCSVFALSAVAGLLSRVN
jgi:hypothetical protein